ncbi:MAG: hypothetical protein WBK54_00940 [Bacilli bacterium]|nr:hypothetical protein [Acholeplasmataceae bacterium]
MILNIYIQAAIVIAVIAIFFLSLFLNWKTKAPKEAELPEQCRFCPSDTCIIKIGDAEKKKEELRAVLEKCEESDEKTD